MPAENATPLPQSHCPFCQSADITTADQKRNAATYWRCEGCGQVWNPDRLRTTSAIRREPRWDFRRGQFR